jgi:hypothetical protein
MHLLLDASISFFMSQTHLKFKFPHVSPFFDLYPKTVKTRVSGTQNWIILFLQTCQIWLSTTITVTLVTCGLQF